jgi:hypothetical protein
MGRMKGWWESSRLIIHNRLAASSFQSQIRPGSPAGRSTTVTLLFGNAPMRWRTRRRCQPKLPTSEI